jgi:hypothetical protein
MASRIPGVADIGPSSRAMPPRPELVPRNRIYTDTTVPTQENKKKRNGSNGEVTKQ